MIFKEEYMKIYKNLARICMSAAAVCTLAASLTVQVSAHSDFLLKVQSLAAPTPSILDFGVHTPVMTADDSLVPVRTLADGVGMTASWDQPSQTATMTLYSCAWADANVERYAAKLMDSVDTYGLDVEPYSITADFKLNDSTAVLKYNYKDGENDIVSIGKTVETADAATLVNDGTLMIPLKSSMELFGLDVEIDEDNMEAEVSIPENASVPNDMGIMADEQAKPVQPVQSVQTAAAVDVSSPSQAVNMDPKLGKYLGRFEITHYCPCSICNGGWGANTAWAGKVVPGQTIAVDPNVIPKLASVYIDGYGIRRAEDCGGAIKENHIDLAVATHAEAISKGRVYKDVYLVD